MHSADVHEVFYINCEGGEGGYYNHILKMYQIRKPFSLLSNIFEENYMHDYDIHGVLTLNCEIYGPCVLGSGPTCKVGPIWPYSYQILEKI